MIRNWELAYTELLEHIQLRGNVRETRNGQTKSVFAKTLTVPIGTREFPLLIGRKMYPKGVLGEFAAMIRKPTTIADFKEWGCNYWDQWGDADGNITVDYGNAWHANGQIERLKDKLANDPNDRRMLISGWRPARLEKLSLPCCHHTYQFYVADGRLNMLWMQRSVDMMIGLPSDIVFAAAWLISLANEFNLLPGEVTFSLGDCHIYEEHYEAAAEYIARVHDSYSNPLATPAYSYNAKPGADFCTFDPADLVIHGYDPMDKLELELKV